MKGCVIALVVLTLIVAAVAGNAVYIGYVTDSLTKGLAALPDQPTADETAAAVAAVRDNFDEHLPLLSITVAYPVLDRITESLRVLETQAKTGDSPGYAATLTLLRELVEEIARLEKLSAENIL